MASGDPGQTSNRRTAAVMAVVVIMIASVAVASRVPSLDRKGLGALVIAAVLLYLPFIFLWKAPDHSRYGIGWGRGLRALLETAVVAVGTLVPFYAVFFRINEPISWHRAVPDHILTIVVIQLTVVALPEEFFFRGWLQTELLDRWGRPWNLLGARLGPGWLLATVIFMSAHFITEPTVDKAVVFFPGLVFGWLRERTSSVIYPILLHASYNVTFLMAHNIIDMKF